MSLVTSSSPPHLILSGEVDLSVAPSLRDAGTQMARLVTPGTLEIDLGDVTFIDSSGLSVIISHNRRAATERFRFAVAVGGARAVERVIDLTGLRTTLTLIDEPPGLDGA